MIRPFIIGGIALVLAAVAAIIVPLWMMYVGMSLSMHGYAAVFLTVFFSFVVAGGLMFLIFYSARSGIDDAAHESIRRGSHDDPEAH